MGMTRGFVQGAAEPVTSVYHAARANRALQGVARGTAPVKLTRGDQSSVLQTMKRAPIGMAVNPSVQAGLAPLAQPKNIAAMAQGKVTPDVAKAVAPRIQAGLAEGVTTLGLGRCDRGRWCLRSVPEGPGRGEGIRAPDRTDQDPEDTQAQGEG